MALENAKRCSPLKPLLLIRTDNVVILHDMSDDRFVLRIDPRTRVQWEHAAWMEGFRRAGDRVNLAGWIKSTCNKAATPADSGSGLKGEGRKQR